MQRLLKKITAEVNEPTDTKGRILPPAISFLLGVAAQQTGVQAPLSIAKRNQVMAQLAEAQKAIDSLKRLLASPAH